MLSRDRGSLRGLGGTASSPASNRRREYACKLCRCQHGELSRQSPKLRRSRWFPDPSKQCRRLELEIDNLRRNSRGQTDQTCRLLKNPASISTIVNRFDTSDLSVSSYLG